MRTNKLVKGKVGDPPKRNAGDHAPQSGEWKKGRQEKEKEN